MTLFDPDATRTAQKWTASQVKDALRRRHKAVDEQLNGPGPWTCIEEWNNIDLLAFSAWAKPYPARSRYSRIGYEVKVSRGDFRSELLNPYKRAGSVAFCHEFYLATPAGLLRDEEKEYEEPEWEPDDFDRTPCRFSHAGDETPEFRADPGPCHKGKREKWFIGPLQRRHPDIPAYRSHVTVKCEGCDGKGYAEKSRVERDAPTLWIPRDVGLVEVSSRGVTVVRKAPLRDPNGISTDKMIADLVRWVSWRPDPRHRERTSPNGG